MNAGNEALRPAQRFAEIEDADDMRLAIYGGSPVRRAPWPTYDKGAVFVQAEDEEAALRAIRSHLYFRYDWRPLDETECGRLEAELCRYFGSKHALVTSSGTTALALAIMAANISPGSLIAVPGFSFVASPSAIVCLLQALHRRSRREPEPGPCRSSSPLDAGHKGDHGCAHARLRRRHGAISQVCRGNGRTRLRGRRSGAWSRATRSQARHLRARGCL